MNARPAPRPRVIIAGASGFIGSAICHDLAQDHEVIALTRSPTRASAPEPNASIAWRHCDLFSSEDVHAALNGADYAIYLVHSMAPSARLTQARPEDMDLLLAEIFGRAAAAAGVKQILFLGAVIPGGFEISRLLWSRRETEMALGAHGVPVTALRADLIVGPGGSSLNMLVTLVRRLPLIPLPRSARSRTQPIALADVLRAVRLCLGRPETYTGHFDIGGPEDLSYVELVRQTAEVLGTHRPCFTIPFLPLRLGAWAVRLVTRAPGALVQPLIESLRQDTVVEDNPIQRVIGPQAIPFTQALSDALDPSDKSMRRSPRHALRLGDRRLMREQSVVRSIQRFVLPPGQHAAWVAGNYFRWLPRVGWPFLRCDFDALGSCTVQIRFPRIHLLTLTFKPELSSPDRSVYFVTDGLLLRRGSPLQGRFEFVEALGGRYVIAGIRDYPPALPWFVYNLTQAPVHLLVMRIYQRHLARLAR